MATTQLAPTDDAPAAGESGRAAKGAKQAKPKKGKKKIIMLVVAGLVVVAGVKFVILKPAPPPTCAVAAPAAGAGTADTTTTTTAPAGAGTEKCTPPVAGAALVLEPITVNLADGHFLKLGLALQLADTADPKVMSEEGGGAKALDTAIGLFGSARYDDLLTPDARDIAKAKLAEIVTRDYDGEVLDVYFTEFVMQ